MPCAFYTLMLPILGVVSYTLMLPILGVVSYTLMLPILGVVSYTLMLPIWWCYGIPLVVGYIPYIAHLEVACFFEPCPLTLPPFFFACNSVS